MKTNCKSPLTIAVLVVTIFALLSACTTSAVVPSAQVIQMCGIGAPQKVTDAGGTTWDCASVRSAFPAAATADKAAWGVTPPAPVATNIAPCNPVDVTKLGTRADAIVNETAVRLEVRDNNLCARPLWYNETGIGKGSNYKLNLTKGWVAITASVSAEIQRDGGKPKQYKDGPVVVIRGPFIGGAGLYEGALRIVPEEWLNEVLQQTLIIQRKQVGNPSLQSVDFDG